MSVATLPPPATVPPSGETTDRYEVVNGRRVELPPMAYFSSQVAGLLYAALLHFCVAQKRGWAVVETLFAVPTPTDPDRNRKPDVAFVSFARWPANRPRDIAENAWPVVPDLAVEVLSPSDNIRDLNHKLHDYFDAGVRLVWVIDPEWQTATTYTSPNRPNGIDPAGTLDGGDVLPGFTYPLADLFAPPPS